MFELLLILTALVAGLGFVWGVFGARDTLHPLVYLMPMSAFLYVYIPAQLYREGILLQYFRLEELIFVQSLNIGCVAALGLGCFLGSGAVRRDASRIDIHTWSATREWREFLFRGAVILGSISTVLYAYQIFNVGGFFEAYSHVKGGGRAASGYVRDLVLLAVPAIALLYLSRADQKMGGRDWLLAFVFSTPLLIHGLLSARRGPTFLGLATLIGGWYLARVYRPRLPKIIMGGTLVGLLMLVLVTYRGQIYLGSAFLTGDAPEVSQVIDRSLDNRTQASFENEYLYGSYVVQTVRDEEYYYYGARYLTQLFVRPIPSQLWTNKYQDVGMEVLLENAGILGPGGLEDHPQIPPGAAPGFAASAFVEFWWGAVVFVMGIGWLYGFAWRRCLTHGGLWTVLYTILLSLSAYFVAQSFMAVFFRLLLTLIPTAMLWNWLKAEYQQGATRPRSPA